jgi:hypothetical protein
MGSAAPLGAAMVQMQFECVPPEVQCWEFGSHSDIRGSETQKRPSGRSLGLAGVTDLGRDLGCSPGALSHSQSKLL